MHVTGIRKQYFMQKAIIVLFITLVMSAPLYINFSEEAWHHTVTTTNPSLLYAPHFNNAEYFNPWNPMKDRRFLTFLKWKLFSAKNQYTKEETEYLPQVISNPLKHIKSIGNADFILWVGHNTFILRINGIYWITDPIFSDKALIIKRKTPPGISLKDLHTLTSSINVIITHNHYDHLDKYSIRNLPHNAHYIVPMGLKKLLQDWGKTNIHELDWWQDMTIDKIRIVCLPAQHWSKRITQSTNSTLWASFMIVAPHITIYIGGDSGYFIGYKEFGKLFSIDYALLPTTAYHPRWFMHYAHMDASEAIAAFNDLGARYFIPTQWGTFSLGEEPPGFPALDLKRKIEHNKLNPEQYIIMNIGEVRVLKGK